VPCRCSASPCPHNEFGSPLLRNYTAKEYGASPQIWAAAQDRLGVMYFGVEQLDLEYDGVTWGKIRVPSEVVRSLAVDAAGRIWVGAIATFGYLESDAGGTLQYVSLIDKIPAGDRSFGEVWPVMITSQGKFFRTGNRIFRWDGNVMHVRKAKTTFRWLSEVRRRIFVLQAGTGIQEPVGDELRDAAGGEAWKDSPELYMLPYDDKELLVAARGETLALYDGEKATPFPTHADEYLRKSVILAATSLPDGSFCVNTNAGGAVIVGHDGSLRGLVGKDEGLQNPTVYTAYKVSCRSKWLRSTVSQSAEQDARGPRKPTIGLKKGSHAHTHQGVGLDSPYKILKRQIEQGQFLRQNSINPLAFDISDEYDYCPRVKYEQYPDREEYPGRHVSVDGLVRLQFVWAGGKRHN
jgi:hypothetical protein